MDAMGMNRREFLFSAGAVTMIAGCRTSDLFGSPDLRFGVVSDIHFGSAGRAEKGLRKGGNDETFVKAMEWFRDQGADGVIIAGDMNADRWGKEFADERLFPALEAAGFANPLGELPAGARGTHPSRTYGDSALDYVFCRGFESVQAPRIVPNDGLSDHLAVFAVVGVR